MPALYIPPKNRQLFFLGQDAINAMDADTVGAIVADLKEMGLYRLPFDAVDIKMLADNIVRWVGKDGQRWSPGEKKLGPGAFVLLAGIGGPEPRIFIYDHRHGTTGAHWEDCTDQSSFRECANEYQDYLIALLATKNVQKTVTENKLAKLGIGKQRWHYTTTLSLPQYLLDEAATAAETGRTVRPHLRRGHIRRQHFGPNNEAIKKVLIDPVFVNADAGFQSPREAYNVRGGTPS